MDYELNLTEREVLRVISEYEYSEMPLREIPLLCSHNFTNGAIHNAIWDLTYAKLLKEHQLYFSLTDEGKAALCKEESQASKALTTLMMLGSMLP